MRTFDCDRCRRNIPTAYTRSHNSWHAAHEERVS